VLSSEKKRKIFAIDTGSKFKPGTRKYTIIQSSHQMNLKVANKISLKVEKKKVMFLILQNFKNIKLEIL
jgi:hypothetical protein